MPSQTAAHRQLRQLVDRLEPRLRAQVEQALAALQREIPLDRLERALASRDAFAIHDLTGTLPRKLRMAVATLQRTFVAGGQAGNADLPPDIRYRLRFDATNPYVVQAARSSAAKFVTNVSEQTRKAIRNVVARAFTDGLPAREAAQLIRPLIGLTTRQAIAVASRRADLIAQGRSRTSALGMATRYAAQLLKERALMIARTEIIRASAEGQLAAWMDAVQHGYLRPGSEKVWIVTRDDRLCPYCKRLDGQRVPLTGQFTSVLGKVPGPPLHPNCRCAYGVIPVAVPATRQAA